MIKKSKYDELHAQEAFNVTIKNFCNMCVEHEGRCRRDTERCYTAKTVMNKIKKIFDKYDK